MNKTEQKQLEAYFAVMKSKQKHISSVEKVLRGLEWRLKNNPGLPLRIGVHLTGAKQYQDHGVYEEMPADIVGPTFLPVLRKKLAELRKELIELPAVHTGAERK